MIYTVLLCAIFFIMWLSELLLLYLIKRNLIDMSFMQTLQISVKSLNNTGVMWYDE